jgi:hypothetical protein
VAAQPLELGVAPREPVLLGTAAVTTRQAGLP